MGVPAGLQKHTIVNHTRVHLPKPTDSVTDRREAEAGHELSAAGHITFALSSGPAPGVGTYRQPLGDRRECVKPDCPTRRVPDEAVRRASRVKPKSLAQK